ncbi:hypothetical protein ACJVC5_08215 [Peredibacter sp. HCB2-198]|uniref:hypothetical protein n=1 Tax=Peredibacter sp. HCB2-198 TaxID=3383025 RepID=UPI0038B61CE3
MLKKSIMALLSIAFVAGSAIAVDEQTTGTITLSGVLAPKAVSIQFAVKDCGVTTDFATCKSTLNAATFSGHAQDVSLNIGNIADGQLNVRYVQFEAKAKMMLFKNDYLQFIAALTSSTNDIKIKVKQLNFVKGGKATFGQTTLGIPGTSDLSLNEPMLDEVSLPLTTNVLTAVWDQVTDNPQQVNDKVFFATATNEELVVRGVLEVSFGETATSSTYNAVVTAGFLAKDN